MKFPLLAITAMWAAVSLLLVPPARADVSVSMSNRTTLDTRSGLLTLNSADVPKAIADNTTVTSSLVVSNLVGAIADVNVSLDITHTRAADLTVRLRSPQGTWVQMFANIGGSGANFTATVLDGEAAPAIASGTAPFTGSFRPAQKLTALDGQNPNGTWTLEILDSVTNNTGTLNNWSLRFDAAPYTYTTSNGKVAITGYTGPGGDVSIPATINGLPVIGIGNWAFESLTSLTSVTIPNSVTIIGDGAFDSCSALTSVVIGNNVESIGDSAFWHCASLTSVTIPNSVTRIDAWAFESCTSLVSVTIPASVTFIGDGAFMACTSLPGFTVAGGNPAFSSVDGVLFNKGLTSLIQWPGGKAGICTIPNTVTSIGFLALVGCPNLTKIMVDGGNPEYSSSVDGVLFNKSQTTLIAYPGGKTGSYAIPAGVHTIATGAFAFCTNLTDITIPNSVNHIGGSAFYMCGSLTNVTIPNSVTRIDEWAFESCTSLASATYTGNAPALGEGVFDDTAAVFEVRYYSGKTGFSSPYWMGYTAVDIGVFPGPLIVLEQPAGTPMSNGGTRDFGTPAVGDAATMVFTIRNTGGLALTGLTIGKDGSNSDDFFVSPPAATSLAPGAFTTFTVTFTPAATTPRTAMLHIFCNAPDDNPFDIVLTGCGPFIYTTVGGTATITGYNGPGGEVTIPATINGLPVTSIGVNAFLNNTSLTSVTIPASVTSIGDAAFSGCTSLASLYFQGNAPILGSAVFDGETGTTAYYWSGTTGWTVPFGGLSKTPGPFTFMINLDDNVTITGYTGPGGAMTIPGTIMGRPVTEIGSFAFYGYSNLTGVTIPSSVIGIGSYAFAFCTRLASVTIPDGVTNIDEGAFLNCTSLSGITLPASVTSIGDGEGADSGSGMFLRNGVFIGCTSLGAIAVDDDNPAFSSVDGVLFNKSLTTLIAYPGGMAGSYSVPAHVSSISFGAFTGATSLLGITVDAGHPVFSSVDGVLFNKDLTTLIACPGGKTGRYAIPTGITRITDGAFGFCSSLTGITIPAGVTRIGVTTFGFCSSLPAVTIPPGVTHIGTSAFLSCTSLTSVTIASTVTSIGEDAFAECARLTDIYFNGDAPDLGGDGYVFDWDTYATVYYLPGTTGWGGDLGGIWTAALPFNYTTSSGAATLTGYTGYNDAVTLPSLLEDLPVTAVGDSAFHASTLTSIMIPDSVTSIGDYAFESCTNLLRVYFLGDAPSAGTEVFLNADDVTVYCLLDTTGWNIPFGDRSTMFWDPQSQLGFTTDGSAVTITRDAGPGGAVNIPDMIAGLPVTDIGNYTFRDNINVTSVAIPRSVNIIGAVAFGGECPFLTEITVAPDNPSYCSVDGVLFNKAKTVLIAYPGGLVGDYTIPDDVTTIGSRAFDGCTYLYNVTIPDGVTDINDAAFMFCGNLTSVMIPKNVSSIGHFVFVGCANLYEILVDGDNHDYRSEDGVLFNDAMTSLIAYPGGRYADYTIPNGVTHIEDWAFALCSGLYSVLIPDSVTTIGGWAFYNCAWLTDVTIPHNVTAIGNYAFDACNSLSSAGFMGNAPTTMGIDVFTDTASGFTVYYYNGATGFTTPTWLGYDAYNMGNPPEIAVEQPLGTDLMDGGASILCGSVTVGDSSTTFTVTVKNVGTDDPTYGSVPLSDLDITTDGANAADFFVTNVSSSTLATGTSTTFTVTFTPTAAGTRTAALHIASNDLDENPFDINLTGIGMLPEIAVEQPAGTDLIDGSASISCGSVNLGSSSSAITFTVKNLGTGILTGLDVNKDGANASEFTIGSLGATDLTPGTSTTFSVTFKPGLGGLRTAAIHIASNDPDENPFDIALTGVGVPVPEITVEQPAGTNLVDGSATISCGSVYVGSAAGVLSFTVKNTGTAILTGLAITKNGTNADDFAVGTLGPGALTPGTSTIFTVTFKPSAVGARVAAIHIASNDSDEDPFDISLTGIGVANTGKDILTFVFPGQPATTIAGTNISVTVPGGTDLTIMAPTYTVSPYATGSPVSGTVRNFTSPQTYLVTAQDGSTKNYTVTVKVPPVFTSTAPPATGKVGTAYNHTCTASGTAPITFTVTSGALPPPLTLSSGGVISGTPGTTGTFSGTITASNGTTPDATQDFSIVITQAPVFTSGAPPATGKVGTAYNHTCTASGTTPITFTVTSGALPASLTLNSDGLIFGTPNAAGTFSGTITAFNGTLPSATQNFSIIINPASVAPLFTSTPPPATGMVGTAYNHTCTASGTTPITFTVTSGALPPPLTLSTGGVISGTPGTTGTFSGTITASNGTAPDATQDFSIVIGPALVPEIAVEQPAGTDLLDGSASLDLGSIHVGSASSDFTFTVRNLGTGDLSGLGIGKSGPNSSDFTVGSPGVTTLTPGANTTFTVSFAPGGAGTRTAVIHLASNDADENPFDIELTGTGLAPVIAVEQPVGSSLTNGSASIHFGSIDIGSASGAFTFTVRNLGTTDLSGLLVSKNGANSGDFTVANPGTTNLTPGTSTTFTVTFTPGAAGARTAAIQLASNDPNNNPFNINLTGTCVAPEPPVVATGSPVAVSTTGATLVGVVNPQGLPTQVYFVYGLTTLYSSSTPLQGLTAGSGFQDVLAPITGLLANVTYHCKLIAVSAAGTTQGDDISFVATDSSDTGTGHPTAKPGVTTGAYADVTTSSAKLLGSVIPNGGTTMVRFEYGTTTAYGQVTGLQSVGNDKVVAEVSQLAQGLQSGTDFHYRLLATNSLGTTVGEDAVFHSLFLPPTVVTGNANALSTTTVRVSGSVRARNATAAVTIEYGTNPANLTNSKTAAPASISGDATTQVSAELTNLAQGTTYYYQVRAETANPGGIGLGGIRSFDVGLLSGLLHQFPGEITAADRQGSVTVNLTPAGIGGLWRLAGERPWRASGGIASGLTIADRVIEYYQVPGYVEPVNETVVISMAAPAVVRDRAYTTAASTGSGGLTVILKPEALAGRAWRLLGESDAQWKDSGSTLTGKTPGDYVIECRAVAGRTTPPLVTAQVADGETTTATLTYFLAGDPVGAAPGSLSFDVVSTRQDRPYAYVGQITSNVGSSTGFVVRPRVVATAGHVVFDDGTLAATTGLQWFFQRDGGVHEPAPLTPRGFYLMAGYAAQRTADNSPGESSPNSQNLDAAALYFLTDAGRGGFSGYLASDLPVNEFVTSTALKTLVGYPIDGIAPANQGRMHATPLANVTFASAFGQTYTTSDIRSSGGGSGGPLCVQHTNGVWYPAAIYLGGTAQTVVRAIDGAVVDLFGFAESSAYASGDGTGGTGMQITTAISSPTTGAIQVVIEPAAARAAGAGWRVHAQQPYELSGTQINGLNPNSYTVQLATISGFLPPTPQTVALQVGQLTTLTFTYEKIILPPHITSPEAVTGTRGQPLGYQIIASNSPDFFTQLGALPAGMSFNSEGPGRISGTPQEAGTFPVTVGATNAGGSDTKVVTLTVRPVLAAQAVTVPYQQPMSYPIVSSETGAGVTYANLATLPAGLVLNAATGVITGTPTIPGVYSVPITVTRNGATSAAAILTLSITGTVPEITLEPVASMSIEYGLHATLIVAASGLPTPTDFQWYEGNSGVTTSPVTGATSSTFTTPVLTSGKSYWARVGNISGSADSQAAVISVVNSTNANLASLTPSAGTLSPAFNAGTLTYAAAVPYAVSTIRLTPKVQIAQSTVTINSAAVTAGVACDPLALVAGPNVFVIGVTAGNGNTKTYTLTVTRAQPPIATTEPATDVNDVAATLHGTVVPNSPVSARFEYGRTNSYGDVTSWQSVSGTAPVALQAALTNLAGDTTYHYRIIVMAGSEMFTGGDMAFTTSHARPLAVTGTPAYVNPTTQKLIGAVNPNGNETTVYFQYGPDATYGTNTTPQNFTAGFNVKDVFAEITGLTPDAFYHCRIVATSAGGLTSYGDDVLFQAIFRDGDGIVDAPPVVTISAATDLTTTSAFLHGSVHPKEGTTIVHFEYGQTPDCDNSTFSEGIGNGNVVALVSIPVTGLLPDTLYYYRLVATNSLGTVTAPVLTDPPATFHTISLQLPPIVTTGNVVALSSTSVTLNGSVRAQGGNAEVWFDYGTDGVTFPDSVLAFQSPVTGDVETPVSADLTNLNGVLHYYFKVRATSLGGERTGDVASFQVGALRGLVQDFTREVAAGDRQGQVLVNLLPAGIGGWRFLGESQWRATGVAATGLTTSDRVIEYQAVPGYIQPLDETVVVDNERQPHVELTRNYYDSAGAGTGVLRVMLEPEAIAGPGVPEVSRAQWRLVAAGGGAWMNSGAELSGLMAGSYLVECKPVSGKNTPPPTNVRVADGAHATASITYFPASAPNLNPPLVVPFATVSTSSNLPYAYVGQIRSGTGSHSGFVVKPRVVATAAQAVFDEATLAATNDIQWLLQRDRGTYEPDPQVPRGFYSFDGYAAQRSTEHTPGILSLESQNLNVAAIYFAEDAGRGGFSGFLASDAADNEFLKSTALKTLVGYPVNGIASANQGRMHATRPVNATFTLALGRTFTTPDIRGIGGMTGGPLCVQRDGGTYYPAGIHVGGITQGVVRAIDSGVIDLFTRAEISSNGGDNNTGGGITHSSFTSFGSSTLPGGIHVTITPAAVAASGMGGWQLKPKTFTYNDSGVELLGLAPSSASRIYTLQFKTVSGYKVPADQTVVILGGKTHEITFAYEPDLTPLEAWRMKYFGTKDPTGPAADDKDPDGDGQPNISEFAADTNPNNAADVFKVLTATKTATSYTVTAVGKAARTYTLERSTSLTAGSWTELGSVGPLAADGPVVLSDTHPPASSGFYRLRVTAP